MPDYYCFLCASDEGVFLDVTTDNQSTFGDQLETCLTTKITENIELSNKVCYKCAYELDQCTKFVKKYKSSHEILSSKAPAALPSCCLCLELADNRTFDITKDNRSIFSPLQKIRNIFNEDLTKTDEVSSKLICLTCRYNLDVLYDLKKIYQEAVINLKALINKEIDYSSFPKVHTDVVNRKTTVTTFPDITFYGSLSSDSEGEIMTRHKSRVKNRNASRGNAQKKSKDAKAKVRTCDECHNVVANGSDMYRFHRTGLTVCKSCWITMDPNRSKGKRQKNTKTLKNTKGTKLCTVFLTDVLSEDSHEKPYKLEKDEDGNKLYVILDDSSEDRSSVSSRQSVSPKAPNHTAESAVPKKRGRKRRLDIQKDDVETTPVKLTKMSTQASTATPETRLTRSKTMSDREQSPNVPVKRRGRKKASTASSDSDLAQLTTPKGKRGRTPKDRAKPASPVSRASPTSPAENTKKYNKKRPRSSTLDGAARSEHSDASSNENSQSRKKRNVSGTSSVKPEVEVKPETLNRTRSSSISSTESSRLLAEFKSPESVEVKAEYTCDKCSKKFDNKVLSVEHRLTHLKQVTLKLERISVDSEKQETKEDETTSKEVEPSRTESIDKQGDDPSEEIAINVEDDTDDEDIFSLSTHESKTEEKVEVAEHDKSETSEKAEAADKLDTPEDESQRTEEDKDVSMEKDESQRTEEDKDVSMEEPEQREESTLDKPPVTPNTIQEKDTKDKDEQDQDVTTPIEEATDTSKDEDVKEESTVASADQDAEECERVQTEDEAELLDEKTEDQPVSECNNDTEKVQEATHKDDKETVAESLVNNAPKNQDETSTNESEANSRDNKDEKVEQDEGVEITRDNNLMDESQESIKGENEEESEKKNQSTTDIASKTVANDKQHSDDVTIKDEIGVTALEQQQQQNGDDPIVEMLIGKPNGVGDEVKPDLTKCDKLDGTANNVEDDNDDIVMVPLANNNDVTKAKLTDEAFLSKDDPSDESRLEDSIRSLDRLIKETVVSEGEYGEQENSNHVTSNDSPADAASEILSEVFNLAAAEVQKREDNKNTKILDDTEIETLENISREIRNSADMPSLDPISMIDLDDDDEDDNDDAITLN